MKKFKKVIFFIIVLAIFMIPGFIFGRNTDFYKEINKPVFAPKGIVFSIVWVFLYTIQSYYITHIFYNYKYNNEGNKLFILLIINGVINILYMPIFFWLESLFGGFVISLLLFIEKLICLMFFNLTLNDISLMKFIWIILAMYLILLLLLSL